MKLTCAGGHDKGFASIDSVTREDMNLSSAGNVLIWLKLKSKICRRKKQSSEIIYICERYFKRN